jgi:hypothetical protein
MSLKHCSSLPFFTIYFSDENSHGIEKTHRRVEHVERYRIDSEHRACDYRGISVWNMFGQTDKRILARVFLMVKNR